MKRQENPLNSSSSRRETLPENHQAKSIGCMSGLFHLVCKYQKRRKFLTSAQKQDRVSPSSPKIPKPSPEVAVHEKTAKVKEEEAINSFGKSSPPECDFRRFSCEAPRNRTLAADIQRSNSVNSPENFRRPQTLVARLMGLDEIPVASPKSASEKRQKLLGALEKCDEDLKALRKIIESIRLSDQIQSPSPTADWFTGTGGSNGTSSTRSDFKVQASYGPIRRARFQLDSRDSIMKHKSSSEYNGERPSPVSVLDEISSPPFTSKRRKNGEYKRSKEDNISFSFHRITAESLPRPSGRRGDYGCEYFWLPPKKLDWVSPFSSSRAMVESVNEVCQEVNWEEKRELRRIGLAIQDYIFAGLIEEVVKELECCSLYSSLRFEACRKRLCF
ncbi:uncharacterized protein LOC122064890 [Macadamia integrifolia]|uniref:uncharacterized protein LOC122064890 n=1 Tax=Macadamia integrifolia TaxID=60698 RepID=UPI001C4F72A1|nr:uncharacterized protein LOC122064890 [Macadamia integrifolia]